MRGDRDILWKWVIIGDSGVGKTSILSRLCNDEFNNTFISTIGIDFKIKKMEVNGKNITVQIWDTAGQERFGTITKSCYRGSVGVILVYDTNSRTSFEDVNKWLNDIKLHTGENVAKILLGNKCDMQSGRAVSPEEGQEVANHSGIPFMETSAKNGKNIEKAFTTLAEQILGESIINNNDDEGKNKSTSVNNKISGSPLGQSSNSNSVATSNSTQSVKEEYNGFRNHRNSLSGIIKLTGLRASSTTETTTPESDRSFQLTEQNISTANLNTKKSRCC